MNHLSTETLNMYLDDLLDSDQRSAADAHLATCTACRADLAALRELFATLVALPPDPLPADLTAQVLQRIAPAGLVADQPAAKDAPLDPHRQALAAVWVRARANVQAAGMVLVVQAALVIALAIWLAPLLAGIAAAGQAALRLPTPPAAAALDELYSWLAGASAALARLPRAGDRLSVASLITLSAAQWALVLAGVGVVWFFGNRFLLAGARDRHGNHQEAA
jgi:anti-sigma factor RsiW